MYISQCSERCLIIDIIIIIIIILFVSDTLAKYGNTQTHTDTQKQQNNQ